MCITFVWCSLGAISSTRVLPCLKLFRNFLTYWLAPIVLKVYIWKTYITVLGFNLTKLKFTNVNVFIKKFSTEVFPLISWFCTFLKCDTVPQCFIIINFYKSKHRLQSDCNRKTFESKFLISLLLKYNFFLHKLNCRFLK